MSNGNRYEAIKSIAELKAEAPGVPAPADINCYGEDVFDLDAMRRAAAMFVGRHDFAPFAANPNRELESTVRTVFSFEVRNSGPRYTFVVRGDGFLYKQVRSMAGFLLSVGKGNERPEAVREILDAASPRTARVETAPGRGLCLWKVFY